MAPLLPTLAAHARRLLTSRELSATLIARDDASTSTDSSSTSTTSVELDPSVGVTNPNDINNTFVFVLFGLIGVAFVVTGIWFFFWAKNGGFYFRQDDWTEYKSTVLRRRGPNGTLLSGATPSTDLGGGSVYKDIDDGSTEYTGGLTQMTETTGDTMSTLSGITAGASDIAGRERRRRAREKKEREHEKRKDRRNRSSRRKVGEDGALVDQDAEDDARRNLRAYRSERPARVGGINKESEGSEWDGSTNPESSTTAGSELLSNRQSTPTSTPTKSQATKYYSPQKDYDERDFAAEPAASSSKQQAGGGGGSSSGSKKKTGAGIRKVYSAADRTANRENERLRAEARRLAEKGRAAASSSAGAPSRNFSFQRADLRGGAIEEETGSMLGGDDHHNRGHYLPPGNHNNTWAESDIGDGSDLGTKSYRHVIPGLSSSSGADSESLVSGSQGTATDYAEEKRRKRGVPRYRRE